MSEHDALARGRAAFDRDAWAEACRELGSADAGRALEADDLQRLATAAYLVGEDALATDALTRAHARFLEQGDSIRAARSAIWLAFFLAENPGSGAQAGGWLARAQRLLEECGRDCVERGFLLCSQAFRRAMSGDVPAAVAAYEEAASIAARFRDRDVMALARHGQARGLVRLGRRDAGFALMDEVMVAVAGGEVSPMITGVVYCSVISACYDVFDVRRAQEWTTALSSWCAAHPDMVPFRTQCLVRRSELLQLHGEWSDAFAEARRAADWCARTPSGPAAGAACYQQGELHRLRGECDRADEWYRRASQAGRKPYPGLALLRLAQGELDAAEAAVHRMLLEIPESRGRARVLSACVDVLLARGDVEGARRAVDELTSIAVELDAPFLHASAAHAAGSVLLGEGDAVRALTSLREAGRLWQELDAPYEIARVRVSIGRVYRRMGDEEGAQMEFEAALEHFDRLGATPDAAAAAALVNRAAASATGPLTGRELEVLRLVAAGKTNRTIGAELAISEKTVARHMSNIFTKLDLTSRAAATAYAYEHKLL
jgi:DNA-binding CsgD family transcriptional regulator